MRDDILRYACIMLAEGDKHHIPAPVRVAVPITVACVVMGLRQGLTQRLVHRKVFGALGVAKLSLCDFRHGIAPEAAHALALLVPVCRGLNICGYVRQTFQRVGMLRDGAGQHPLVAVCGMGVGCRRGLAVFLR